MLYLVAFFLVVWLVSQITWGFVISVGAVFVGLLAILLGWGFVASRREEVLQAKIKARQVSLESADRKVSGIVAQQLDALANRRMQLIRVDPYGNLKTAAWQKELRYFFDTKVRPALTDDEFEALDHWSLRAGLKRLIDDPVAAHRVTRTLPAALPAGTTPIEFEELCAETLERFGWTASTTKGSGDQGADVIAIKDGRKLVLQCKLHASPVGNKAVQEVLGAKQFYAAELGPLSPAAASLGLPLISHASRASGLWVMPSSRPLPRSPRRLSDEQLQDRPGRSRSNRTQWIGLAQSQALPHPTDLLARLAWKTEPSLEALEGEARPRSKIMVRKNPHPERHFLGAHAHGCGKICHMPALAGGLP
ncbi:restriction endonuclease [Rubellimicrobium rubrum]|uniref:Restriction endonuclease n=1 Tax=Rubellimicrobium rubrum TaxID=2585369 RepID=A0A5C4MWB6_9RHOB|nr:restriction endonuclease [Rubellimicrobium rubrum]